MKPLISIIVPVYNAEKYIKNSINSILMQKNFPLSELEAIVVDDKSKDRSLSNIKSLCNKNLNIKLIKHNKKKGASVARNTAINLAEGKYLLILDADDLLHEDCIHECIDIFEKNPSAGFIYSDHASIGPDIEIYPKKKDILSIKSKPDFHLQSFLEEGHNYIAHVKAIRRDLVLPFDSSIPYSEDADWIIRLALKGTQFYHIPKVLYFWRRGIDSISSRTSKAERDKWHNYVFQKGLNEFNKK